MTTLLVALPVYGLAGTLIVMLGIAHTHRGGAEIRSTTADAGIVLEDFRRIQRATTGRAHTHDHAHGLARHHHAANDDTVVSFDSSHSASEEFSAPAGSAALVLALSPTLLLPAMQSPPRGWVRDRSRIRVSFFGSRLERPPKA